MCRSIVIGVILAVLIVTVPFLIVDPEVMVNILTKLLSVSSPSSSSSSSASSSASSLNKIVRDSINESTKDSKKNDDASATSSSSSPYYFVSSGGEPKVIPHDFFKQFESLNDLKKKNDLGSYNFATIVAIKDKMLIFPALSKIGLSMRQTKLVPVTNVTRSELKHGITQGKTFMNVFLVMEAYMKLTNKTCMGMHHLSGYKGGAKKVAAIMKNNGRTFIAAINPVINSKTTEKFSLNYTSTLCPKATLHFSNVHYGVSLKYIRYDNIYNPPEESNLTLESELETNKVKKVTIDENGVYHYLEDEEPQSSKQQQQQQPTFKESAGVDEKNTKTSGVSSEAERQKQELRELASNGYVPIEEEWFEGETSACLQILQKEFEGFDVCEKKYIYENGKERKEHEAPLPFDENVLID